MASGVICAEELVSNRHELTTLDTGPNLPQSYPAKHLEARHFLLLLSMASFSSDAEKKPYPPN